MKLPRGNEESIFAARQQIGSIGPLGFQNENTTNSVFRGNHKNHGNIETHEITFWKTRREQTQLGDRFLSSAGTGKNCALSMRFSDHSPVLDKNRAPMGPEILSSTGAGAWRKAPMAFPDSSSVLDKFQSVTSPEMEWEVAVANAIVATKVVAIRVLGGRTLRNALPMAMG